MQTMIDDIRSVFADVWASLFDCPIEESPWDQGRVDADSCLSAWVCFSVGWNGVLHLTCSLDLAKEVAGVLFGGGPAERTTEDAEDALGELANMVGGNIKSILPPPCSISIPHSAHGCDDRVVTGGFELETELGFMSGSLPLRLRLLRAIEPDLGDTR